MNLHTKLLLKTIKYHDDSPFFSFYNDEKWRILFLGGMDFEEGGGGDLHVGAAEEGDADADVGVFVGGESDDLGELVVAETDDADVIADGKAGGGELNLGIALGEHGLQEFHLGIGDDGEGFGPGGGLAAGGVGHEGQDVGEAEDVLPLSVGDMHEDDVGDEDFLDGAALSPAPHVDLLAGGDIGVESEVGDVLANGFFGTGLNSHDVPAALGVGYASGAVSCRGWRRAVGLVDGVHHCYVPIKSAQKYG